MKAVYRVSGEPEALQRADAIAEASQDAAIVPFEAVDAQIASLAAARFGKGGIPPA